MVEQLRPTIEKIASSLIEMRRGEKEHELIRDFSYLLPVTVIMELLGIPGEGHAYFRKWAESMIKFIDFNITMEEYEKLSEDIKASAQYIRELIEKRRIAPRDDLISGLITVEESGDKLNEDEMVATCLLLLIAGHETTVNLITNGYYLLLKHPEQYQQLKNNPSLISNAVEEILRFEPPVAMSSRWVSQDLEFAGQQMKQAQYVMISFAAANRDPKVNKDPDIFDISRKQIRHLSFSTGPHFCLGAPLARLEGEIALEKLIKHFNQPELISEPVRRNNIAFRGFESLHLRAEIV